jgi:hypothetical protein
MAVAGIGKALLNLASKKAKDYIKKNPGKSNIDILESLQKNFNFPLTRLKTDNVRNVTKRSASHEGDKLIQKIFTKNQLQTIKTEAQSATKKLQWEKGVLGSEEHVGKLSTAQKDQIKKAFEKGYSDNPTIQNIVDFANVGGESQSLSTYAKLQQNFAKQFGKGDLRKLRKKENKDLYADFNEAFNLRRFEAQLMRNGLLDELTPANQLLTKYGRQGWGNVLDERAGLTSLAMDESKIGKYLLDLGYDRNQIIASIGHDYPLKHFASLIGGKGRPNMTPFRAARLVNRPENIRPELGFMNQAKARGIEPFLYEKPLWYADDMGIMNKIMKDAQLTSKFYGPTGTRQQIGTSQQIDPKQLLQYLKYIHKDKPFGSAKFPRTLPTRGDILKLLQGDIKYNFAAGGIANIGAKILPKLAKKLSDKELKLVMETLWKGVDPKQSARYRAWAKNRWGPGYKWPYEKSRIKGPEIKKSHFANLSPGERVELQSKYADQLWEYQMKKKLKMPMDKDLPYPFLSPDNKAFISTSPRTGLGRYQMRHSVDPENVGPISKYAVYDWWDDILQQMRKKPKFKYVKDDKGNVIMKKVK